MNFCSDNVTGAAPEIFEALARANAVPDLMPYGADEITERVGARFREIFERDLAVYPVATGTAANAIGLATAIPPYGAVYCHEISHIATDECGAPELFSGGAKLVTLAGADGKLAAADLDATIVAAGAGVVHHVQPAAISVTQQSEAGTVYAVDQLGAIAEVARKHDLVLHMDGARFANALVALDCSPAEATWKAGVDILAFGATKNGALAAEAVLFFDRDRAADFECRRTRGGHLFSKMRFLSAQLEAYLDDDRWLRHATHANAMAARLADGLAGVTGVAFLHPVEGNEIFVRVPGRVAAGLEADGFKFYRWIDRPDPTLRLVTAWNTDQAHVDAFVAGARMHAAEDADEAAAG